MSLILFYDTETTSFPLWSKPSGDPGQPHIVSLAAKLVDSETRKAVQTIDLICFGIGMEVSPEAAEMHGITTEYAERVGIPEQAALVLFMTLHDCADLRVGHNEPFDSRIIRIALKRYLNDKEADIWKEDHETACTMRMATDICQLPDPKGKKKWKWPNLGEAYKTLTNKTLENAHTAMADVDACIAVYFGIKDMEAS